MKIISKTLNKIVIEVTSREYSNKGFDRIWDEIREIYPDSFYNTDEIRNATQGRAMTIILRRRNVLGSFF